MRFDRTSLALLTAGALVLTAGSAAAGSLITGASIKDGTITARDLAPSVRAKLAAPRGAVAGNRVVPGPAGAQGERGPAGATGPQGVQGPAGAPGGLDPAKVRFVEGEPVGVNGGQTTMVMAACQQGETAISGGYFISSGKAKAVISRPVLVAPITTWQVLAENEVGASTAMVRAYVVCAGR